MIRQDETIKDQIILLLKNNHKPIPTGDILKEIEGNKADIITLLIELAKEGHIKGTTLCCDVYWSSTRGKFLKG